MNYYDRHYPHARIQRLLAAIDDTGAAELILRASADLTPLRHLAPADITPLLRHRRPADGAHLALSEQCTGTLVLDVDAASTRTAPYCSCPEGARMICDNCWVAMAGTLRGYASLLRTHFGCTQLLACFSGGRGWHLFVLDAHQIDRSHALLTLGHLVPDTVRHVAQSFLAVNAQLGQSRLLTMQLFDPLSRLPRLSESTTTPLGAACLAAIADRRVLDLYNTVLLPYFCSVWCPRVLGCDVELNEAVATAGKMMMQSLQAGHVVARAYETAAALPVHAEPLASRIDAFLCVMTLLWHEPDYALLSARHPIRLPWSPHARSGRFSLPLCIDRAHELRPHSLPPHLADIGCANTAADVWFRRSLQVVDDLLQDRERTPRVSVWPT